MTSLKELTKWILIDIKSVAYLLKSLFDQRLAAPLPFLTLYCGVDFTPVSACLAFLLRPEHCSD